MKRSSSILIVLLAILIMPAMVFAAGNRQQSSVGSGGAVHLLFGTHSVGTATYNISAGLGQLWERYLPAGSQVDVQPISPGGMGAPYLFEGTNTQIAFINGAPAKWAYEDGTLGRPPTKNYRGLVGELTAVSAVNFLTESFIRRYNVTSVEDALRRKLPIRIGCSPKGSMDEKIVEMLLSDYLGITYDDVKSWGGDVIHGGGSDLASMVKDGNIDMMLDHTSAQSSTMVEIAMTSDVRFMEWEKATLDWFYAHGFQPVILPANSFKGQTTNITNAGTPDCIFVSVNMSDDVAYAMVKAMDENRAQLIQQYSSLSPFNPATAWEPIRLGGVPLHPGAERYYREKGYMK
ncbi:MAG: TAXI family TRAP transporter solute-binding subunit [Treponema sp.]|jgi:TRAP transporter TAXI family solute receptor|nr:TAXI family TRAP transporter solute-binding subunit [Treponema sp.]